MNCPWSRQGARRASVAAAFPVLGSVLACALPGFGQDAAEARGCFSTALVFAIDASSSIDDAEYLLQMTGLSQALRDPEVAGAVQKAGGVALAAVIWSDTAAATGKVGWQSVRSQADIEHFARTIEALPRVGGGGTDLGQGVTDALDLLDDPALCAARRVIDVSGDGSETLYPRRRHGISIFSARRRAEAAGVTINGLAIIDEEADLKQYYLDKLVVGHGSFVIVADSFEDFEGAMRSKLLREISPIHQAELTDVRLEGDATY